VLIVGSLLSALGFLLRDKGGQRTARALALRVGLSMVLFVLLMLAYASGLVNGKL
jgi:hypothetical protein